MATSSMDPSDWAGIAFGLVSGVIAVISLFRSVRSDRLARAADERAERNEQRAIDDANRLDSLRLAGKRQDALNLTYNAELALLSAHRTFRAWWSRALGVGDYEVLSKAQEGILSLDTQLAFVETGRNELTKRLTDGESTDLIESVVDKWLDALRDFNHPEVLKERWQGTLDQFEQVAATWGAA